MHRALHASRLPMPFAVVFHAPRSPAAQSPSPAVAPLAASASLERYSRDPVGACACAIRLYVHAAHV